MTPTRVYITVDVECAERRTVRGRSQPPIGYDMRVWGRFANCREELGIPWLMSELEEHGFRATFYTEVLGAHHFGMTGLRAVIGSMLERGHDVQLHLHPVQRRADVPDVSDDIGAYDIEAQVGLLREGIQLLTQAGVAATDIVSFRAGNFGANNQTWEAMRRVGLPVSSNYNPYYFDKNCRMRSPLARAGLFRTEVDGVWELPIANFAEPSGAPRHMQLTAVSNEEMFHALWRLRDMGVGHVALVTHSFEFFYIDSIPGRIGHRSWVNQRRLRRLLRFLRTHSSDFKVETVRELAASRLEESPDGVSYPRETRRLYYGRLLQQAVKRVEARYRGSYPLGS